LKVAQVWVLATLYGELCANVSAYSLDEHERYNVGKEAIRPHLQWSQVICVPQISDDSFEVPIYQFDEGYPGILVPI
jgi:hypothetical protein